LDARPSRSDCYIEEDVTGAYGSRIVICNEGADPCDTDGVPNDVCVFNVALCPNQTNVPGCTPSGPLTRLRVRSIPKGTTLVRPTDLSAAVCGPPTNVVVPMRVTRKGRKIPGKIKLIVTATSSGKPKKDRDEVTLICEPHPPCEVCCQNPDGGPDELELSTLASGSDLDIGWGGGSHDFIFAPHSGLNLCLSGCNADTNPICDAAAPIGEGSLNGTTFGPPLPLIAQDVPVCVVNRYHGDISGKVNVQTGEVPTENPLVIELSSDVHLTLPDHVCPRCMGNASPEHGGPGTCDGGANRGRACTIDSVLTIGGAEGDPVYPLSKDCPPDSGQLAGTFDLKLALTTGTSMTAGHCPGQAQDDACHGSGCGAQCTGSACATTTPDGQCVDAKGGISQVCCNDSTDTPCFPDPIVRTGTASPPVPAWPDPTYPKTSTTGALVATLCVGATNAGAVDMATGLPGPGAIILPVGEVLLRLP
jgi:hypothetical protein